jgi:nucleotide-binding universal stress UspA family protein
MFKNVLIGIDGGSGGRDAIALASRLKDADSQLTLAHVHSGELHPLHAVTPGLVREERAAAARLLEDERDAAHVSAELAGVVAMSAGHGLHIQAEQQGADLIVVGSCSRGAWGRAMLGDDTRAALNGAPCAVAIAARGYAERSAPVTKLGVAYNGSPESQAALALARELGVSTRAAISAVEVVSPPTYSFTGLVPMAMAESMDLVLEEANRRLAALPDVDGRAVFGLVGEELARFSGELDILVVGSRGYGPLRRMVLGSTSDYLERHARCSLLVLPRGSGDGLSERVPDREPHAAALA